MYKIIFASHNANKLREIRQIISIPNVEILGLNDFPNMPEVEETGLTFAENAFLKAQSVSSWSGLPTLADDSGLEVDVLDGAPGVHSARYGNKDFSGVELLLHNLEGVLAKDRMAHFRCVAAFADPGNVGKVKFREGFCEGIITEIPYGFNGFEFDPVFYVEEFGQTFAEMSAELKNSISHRGKAMRLMADFLKLHFGEEDE